MAKIIFFAIDGTTGFSGSQWERPGSGRLLCYCQYGSGGCPRFCGSAEAGDLSLLQRKAFHIKSVHLENTGVQLFADSKKLKCQ